MTHTDSDQDQKEIFLVDGSGFIFRAYHALPPLTRPDGTPVGAVLGFTNMLVKLLNDYNAPYAAVIFDAARKNFRNDIYKEYKANRDETPEDLVPQFPLIREATKAFDLPALELEGYEADDLIATYAKCGVEKGYKVTVVSSDKDLMQLVDDERGIRMLDPMKQNFIQSEDVIKKFGVTPEKVIDVQALAGDSVDNVPGVPGIGIKTAALLINEYGDLETLLERASEIKQPKRRENLIEHAEMARISKKLVALDQNVDVPEKIEELKTHNPDMSVLGEFLQEQGFKSVMARLGTKPSTPDTQRADAPEAEPLPPASENTYTLINDTKTLQRWIDKAYETGILAIDTETTGLTPSKADLVGISLSSEIGEAAYIPLGHVQEVDLLGQAQDSIAQLPMGEAISLLKPLLEDESVLKIGHNIKYDWQILAAKGIHMTPLDDTMLLSYVLDGALHGHGMDELALTYCGHETIKYKDVAGTGKNQVTFDLVPIEKALDYAAEDAEITLRLHTIFKPRLAQEQMVSVYETLERPLIPVIAQMEMEGFKIDPLILKNMSEDFGKKLALLEEEIHKLAGHPFNVASPKQLGVVLFDEMGFEGGKKTKTGDWSTSAALLEQLAVQGHEIVEKVLEWRQLAKLKSTYTDALQNEINPKTGRIHTSFHMAGTVTGRLSSSDPNLQNIPIRTEEGRKIRKAFITEPGWKILSVDYSQVELRLAAEVAGVQALIQAFKDGVDIHALTASQVFGVPLEEVSSDIRRQAKAVNFGIIYGISPWGLAKQLGCEPEDARDFINRYLSRFSEIRDYMDEQKDLAKKQGYVSTLYGRKCYMPGITDKNGARRAFAERQAINAPLQGTAADIMKRAMIQMPKALKEANLKARMLIQVHDELIFEVPESELDQTSKIVRHTMESITDLSVPLDAEAGSGDSWAEAH